MCQKPVSQKLDANACIVSPFFYFFSLVCFILNETFICFLVGLRNNFLNNLEKKVMLIGVKNEH